MKYKGIKSKIKGISALLLVLITANANAAVERHLKGMMCKADEVFFIDPTSNYAKESAQFISDIMIATEQIKMAIEEGSARQTGKFSEETASLIKSLMKMDETVLKQRLKQDKTIRDQEMNYEANIAEEKVRQSKSVLFKDDTKEEMKLITLTLEENSDLPVPSIIIALTEKYDVGGKKIPIPIKAAEGVCSEEDVEIGYCSIEKNITPGKKLAKFFKDCSTQKRELARKKQELTSQKAIIAANSRKTDDVINTVDGTSKQRESLGKQKQLSCTVQDYKNGVCANGMSKEDFQEKVALNHIIPNGTISPDNLLSPSFFGGADLRQYDAATIKDLKDKALSKDEIYKNHQQSVVPIVNTYKNSNQYVAATYFVDNISGSYLISNQPAEKRKKPTSTEFQALYNKRMAALSLVRSTFMSAIKKRTGSSITAEVEKGTDFSSLGEPIKESVLGASSYDILLERVDNVFSSVAMKATADIGENSSMDEINNGSENQLKKIQLDTLKLQTEILFKSLMEDEQIELLKAAQISTLINSPEMLEYLRSIR
jgi:hypothetical protein